jgi:hypothetical protein
MKIAQYRYTSGDAMCIFPAEYEKHGLADAVRISEYLEVEFAPRSEIEVAAERKSSIDARLARLSSEMAKLQEELASP